MCMEDVRLGRETALAAKVIVAANGVKTPIATVNEKRTSIVIAVVGANNAIVAPETLDSSLSQGILLAQTSAPLVFDLVHHGRLVQAGWNGTGQGAAANVTVLETFLEKD